MGKPLPKIMYDCQGADCLKCEKYAVCKSLDWNEPQIFTTAEKIAALVAALEKLTNMRWVMIDKPKEAK